MPGGCFIPGFYQGDRGVIGNRFFEDFLRRVPLAVLYFTEIPGMTFTAGKVAPAGIRWDSAENVRLLPVSYHYTFLFRQD